jgi:hypothetical protein
MAEEIKAKKKRTLPKGMIPWKPGQPGNPRKINLGAPKGVKKWSVIFRELFTMTPEEIKRKTGIDVDKIMGKAELQYLMAARAIFKGIGGDFNFYKSVLDRMDGEAKQTLELNGDLAGLIKSGFQKSEQDTEPLIIESNDEK